MKYVTVLHLLSLYAFYGPSAIFYCISDISVSISVVFFIVEYSFMSTLVWHLYMTSLKPVLNLPAAGVDIIIILCLHAVHLHMTILLYLSGV